MRTSIAGADSLVSKLSMRSTSSRLIERRTLAGREFVIVDLANEQAPADKKQRVIGAIVPASGETWFFKMTGDDALTAAQKPAFLEVLESAEFRSQ